MSERTFCPLVFIHFVSFPLTIQTSMNFSNAHATRDYLWLVLVLKLNFG